jgi:hypothetical protein
MIKYIKKFKKNDYSYEEEDQYDNRSRYIEKKNEKRIERALKTRDISSLTEEDEDDYWEEDNYSYGNR